MIKLKISLKKAQKGPCVTAFYSPFVLKLPKMYTALRNSGKKISLTPGLHA